MKKPIPVASFLHLVTRLSNTCFVRHWMRWQDGAGEPYGLALCCIEWEGQPMLPYRGDIEEWDFITESIGVNTIFRFRRAD